MKNKFIKRFLIIIASLFLLILLSVVAFVICMYQIASSTQLEGRLGGPQDAFRHTYTSAVVTRYIGEWAVEIATKYMEHNQKNKWDKMDIHNNKIGTILGKQEGEIKQMVLNAIKLGKVNSDNPEQITWLPKKYWTNGL